MPIGSLVGSVEADVKRPGHFLISELPGRMSREVKTLASGQTVKAGQVCATNSAGKKIAVVATGNETHTYTFTGTPTSGNFRLRLWHKDGYWVETADIAYNASNGTLDTAIEAVLGTSAVTATATGAGTAITVISIVFGGTGYASLSQPQGAVIYDGMPGVTAVAWARATSAGAAKNEVQTVSFGAAATGGTVKIGVTKPTTGELVWTDAISWNTTDATFLASINTALDSVLGVSGAIVATAIAATDTDLGFVLTFSGTGYSGIAHALVSVDTAALTSVTSCAVTRTTAGGLGGGQVNNTADCIAYAAIDASSADKEGVFITFGAEVNANALYYGGADVATCRTNLETNRRIMFRDEPVNQAWERLA